MDILIEVPPILEGKDASGSTSTFEQSKEHLEGIGRVIMTRNRAIKIVTVRTSSLSGLVVHQLVMTRKPISYKVVRKVAKMTMIMMTD